MILTKILKLGTKKKRNGTCFINMYHQGYLICDWYWCWIQSLTSLNITPEFKHCKSYSHSNSVMVLCYLSLSMVWMKVYQNSMGFNPFLFYLRPATKAFQAKDPVLPETWNASWEGDVFHDVIILSAQMSGMRGKEGNSWRGRCTIKGNLNYASLENDESHVFEGFLKAWVELNV